MARSGTSALLAYGYESTHGGGASLTRMFGKDQRVSGLEFSNGQIPLPNLYTPEYESFAYGKNHGGCTIDYKLSTPHVLTAILNDYSVSEAAGVYTYTWTSNPSDNEDIRCAKTMHIEFWIKGCTGDAGIDRNAKGVISPTFNLKTAIDQTVDITQTFEWGIEDTVDTTLNATPPTDSFVPYSFVSCTIKQPVSGGTLAGVQSVDINFDTGAELLYQINGTGNANDSATKILNMTGKLNMTVINKDMLQRVIDRTEVADMELKVTNGLTGVNKKEIVFTWTGIGLSKHNNPTIAPDEIVLQDIDFQCRRLVVVATNGIDDTP